jgi:hypothetical protein
LLQDKLGVSNLRSYYWYSEAADTARIGISDLRNYYWYSEAADTARVGCSCWIRDGGCELEDGGSGIRVYEGVLANLFVVNYASLSSSAFSSRSFFVQLVLNSSWFRSRLRVLV